MIEVTHQISAVRRQIGTRVLEAGVARVLTISQSYATTADDLWDVCTDAERISRWFLPVSDRFYGDRRRPDHGKCCASAAPGILRLAGKRRARRIAVFGSVARGEARRGSDVDLLVDFEPGVSLLDQVALFQDLEELLGVGVDVVSRSGLKPRDNHIRGEAVDL